MATRKRATDIKQIAHCVVAQVTGVPSDSDKDPAAVSLGRRGGLKGGPARASKLSKKRRAEIARKAAKARWKGRRKPT
jgi:hypothetical protein